MTLDVDAVVIGAGPAGMACSEVLARHNANVVVLDEQNAPGGQIYKNIEASEFNEKELSIQVNI